MKQLFRILSVIGILALSIIPVTVKADTPSNILGEQTPITVVEDKDSVSVNNGILDIQFFKNTAGYDLIKKPSGTILVYNNRFFLEYKQGTQWKQRGVPIGIEYAQSDKGVIVTRHYTDYLSTTYDVEYRIIPDSPIKITITVHNGQLATYRLAWSVSGITGDNYTTTDKRMEFGKDLSIDWSDAYQFTATSSITSVAQGRKLDVIFDLGTVAAGKTIVVDPSLGDYRKPITITGTTAGAQTNYPMKTIVHKGSGADNATDVFLENHALSWTTTVPGDLRFTKADGTTELDYWIESSDTNTATVWVEYNSIPASPNTATFYMYYGKAAASTTSSGENTFTYFNSCDNLTGLTTAGNVTNSAGMMILDSSSSVANPKAYTPNSFSDNMSMRTRMKTDHSAGGINSESVRFFNVTTGTGTWAWFDYSGPTYPGKQGNYNAGWGTLHSIVGWSAGSFHLFEISRFETTNVKTLVDDANLVTITDKLSTQLEGIDFEANSTVPFEALVTVDWFFVRKYVSPEPIFSAGTEQTIPTVQTDAATAVDNVSATLNGQIIATGGNNCITRGFEWDDDASGVPYANDWHEDGDYGVAAFNTALAGLTPSTTHYFRAYAINAIGTSYGAEETFITIAPPTVTTNAADNITSAGARLSGNITATGGDNSTVRGFEWDTDSGVPYANDWNEVGNYGVSGYDTTIAGLPAGTTIYWRGYATNAAGTGVSAERNFDTLVPLLPLAPTGFTATQIGTNSLTLNWVLGTYATTTIIRAKEDNPPTSITDGYEVYNGALTTANITGLNLGTSTYYYSAWSHNASGYSVDYAQTNLGGKAMIFLGLLVFCGIITFAGVKSSYYFLKLFGGLAWFGLASYWVNFPVITAGSATHTIIMFVFAGIGIALILMPFWYTKNDNGQEVGKGFRLPFVKTQEQEERMAYSPSRRERTAAYASRVNRALRR